MARGTLALLLLGLLVLTGPASVRAEEGLVSRLDLEPAHALGPSAWLEILTHEIGVPF